ncbi:MAG: DUF3298 domain-containing protein [Prevotella sp.]
MRKSVITIILFTIITSICSCGGKSDSVFGGKDSLTFDSLKADSTLWLTGDTTGPRCHVSLNITYAKGKNAEIINDSIIRSGIISPDYFSLSSEKISIKQAVDSFVSRYISEYKKEYGDLYKADTGNAISYNCEYDVNTSILDKSDKYFTYVADVYIYGGGAHGMSVKIVKNIDKASGKIMTLRNVFVPGFEHELNQLILRKLYKQFDVSNLDELHNKTVFLGIDVYPSENFIIGNKSIIFIYSPDEIAFHAAGEIVVEIDKDDLSNLLRKDVM